MSPARRTIDRRRRVLYSSGRDEQVRPTAASRREALRLREARRPTAAYGARVHRRLRARWFSLVPVRRRTVTSIAGVLLGIAFLLCAAHYSANAWPSLAYNEAISRPLRIDRPDSFARLFTITMLAGCAGASLLIYQLRRYRNDDYQGRYRLWRLVLVVMLLASVDALVSLVDWGGALLDATFGKRVALTGSDWLHIVVSVGGAILALRLLAEVRRCRFALAAMALCCLTLAIPQAARWNIIEVNTMSKWVAITSAPMIAFTLLFISFGAYLRMLYREVRNIEDSDSLRDRFQQVRLRLFQRSDEEDSEEAYYDSDEPETPKRRWWRRRTSATESEMAEEDAYEEEEPQQEEVEDQEVAAEEELDDDVPSRKRRGWFGRRRKREQIAESDDSESEQANAVEDEPAPKKKRRGWSMRLSPRNEQTSEQAEEEAATEPEIQEQEPKERRNWFGRKKKVAAEEDPTFEEVSTDSSDEPQRTPDSEDEQYLDENEIDWNSLSKSERRRLRKQLKRQNRAA